MRILSICLILLLCVRVNGQSNLTSKEILNKELKYSFPGRELLIVFSSDTSFYWKEDNGPKEGYEKTKTIHVNEYTIMTSWYNAEKTFVTLLSDFSRLTVSGMVCWSDGRFYPLEGVIKMSGK